MKDIKELLFELESLPRGYISKKTIHGKKYFYLQYLDNKKIVSKYIKENELEPLKKDLERRKEIEKEIDNLISKEKNQNSLSPTTLELSGYIMSEDKVVASFEKGKLIYMDSALAPLIIIRTHDLVSFLMSRVLDTSRTNARLLKRIMNVHTEEEYIIALKNHATSVTDNYWFRSKNSRLKYQDVSLESDIYHEIALKGEMLYFPKVAKESPQYSLLGSYEKCWRLIDNEWYMYKAGSKEERYSEYLAALISKKLGIPTAEYELEDKYIKTKCFIGPYNYESLSAYAGDDDSFEHVLNSLYLLNKELAKQYLLLIWFDALVNNVDRHNENVGFLRDRNSGEIISLAPNYDLNMSLFAKSTLLRKEKDGFINLFLKFAKNNKLANSLYKEMTLPVLQEEDLDEVLSTVDLTEYNFDLKQYLLYRYNQIKNL